jgi:hypothetical protein
MIPQIALPDHGDAVENRDEQDTLRQDAGRHEIDIRQVAGGNRATAREHLPEHQQPERRLHCACQEIGRVMAELSRLHLRYRQRLEQEAAQGGHWIP